ncbi:MAG TPA: hemolysin III family protein [Caulobacterales bacterium]|jgi:hemolysin III|nr:hemolysin III family protein [Caulobacterales bacterium]
MAFADLFIADENELAEHYPSRAERRADMVVHFVGLIGGAVAAGALFSVALARGGVPLATGVALYAVCLMAMLACSAVYNLARPSPARRVLRRLDEGAIFLMIAGSLTPFTMKLLPESLAHTMTAAVWAGALAGAVGKVVWPRVSDAAWCLIYVAFAWAAVLAMLPAARGLAMSVLLLMAAGGVTYSAGVLIYLNQKLPYRRAIWHGIVVIGAGLHYAAILTGVVLSGA